MYNSNIYDLGFEDGMLKGKLEGKLEGKIEGKCEVVRDLIQQGLDLVRALTVSGVSEEDYNRFLEAQK